MIYLLASISFVVSIILIPILRRFGIKYKLIDKPGEFKIHEREISYLGGWGIWLGFTAAIIFAGIFQLATFYRLLGLSLGGLVVLMLGFWDDLKWKSEGRPFIKLILQFLVAFFIVFILLKIGINLQFTINHVVATLIIAFYVAGSMNAINMEDGMDGLAGSLAIISLIGFSVLALTSHYLFMFAIVLAAVGSLSAFLIYNWHPASIFMGDSGSHFIGFLLAVLAITFTSFPFYNLKQFIGPILIIGLPVVDVIWVILRRLKERKLPFIGDRKHLYDRIHQKGVGVQRTVLICCGIQIVLVATGIIIYNL